MCAAIVAIAPPSSPARAQPAASERIVPLREAFPYWERYVSLPATGRDGFTLIYRLERQDGRALPPISLIQNGRRTPLEVASDGRVLRLPTDPAVVRTAQIAAPEMRMRLHMDVRPVLPLSQRVTAAAVDNALSDYEAARRSAGPLSLGIPRLRGITFEGARSGRAELPGGRSVELPRDRSGHPYIQPDQRAVGGYMAVSLAQPPGQVSFRQ